MDSSFRKIFKASGAAGFGQIINIVNQLLLVPVYMRFWGPQLYGEWLILSAAPSVIAMAGDLGFGTVAANEMNIFVAKGNRSGALKVFQNTWIVISIFSILFFSLAFVAISYFQIGSFLNINNITEGDSKLILLMFLANILVFQQHGLLLAALRCEGNYVVGMTIGNISKVCELAFIVLFLSFFNASPIIIVTITLSVSVASYLVARILVAKKSPWVKYGISNFSLPMIKEQTPLAFSFLSFPITQAFSIQGVVIIIGSILGPAAVVLFSTTRTFMNVIKQVVSIINAAIWPELTTAYGQENFDKFKKIFITSMQVLGLILVSFNVFVLLFGEPLYLFWTKGKIIMSDTFFYTFALITSISAIWNLFGIVQAATNKAKKYAFYNLVSIVILISSVIFFSSMFEINGVLIALLLSELFMLFFVVKDALGILKYNSLTDFFTQLFTVRLSAIKYLMSKKEKLI